MGRPANKMTSLLRSLTDRFTPNASSADLHATKPRPDGFSTARGSDALFPRTKPEIDGEDCLHDCETCTIHLPRGFKIDEDDQLFGQVKGFARHLIVATGKTDWVRDVADEKGSVMEAIEANGKDVEGGKLMLSASNMNLPDHNSGPYGKDRPTSVLLMPSFQFVDNVTPNRVPELIRTVINKAPTNTTLLPSVKPANGVPNGAPNGITNGDHEAPLNSTPLDPTDLPSDLHLRTCPHKYVILMCSQATRDARCGQSAPLLRRELERHLRPLGLYRDQDDQRPGGVGIYFISHVGGHKYSANIMVYRRAEKGGEAAQCIWLARIRPENCENVVKFTVLQGKVTQPDRQLRGGFDREKAVVSW